MAKRKKPKPAQVSSPAATGGAGNIFELHVNATLLSLLLVRGIPPVLVDCGVVEVTFQTERLGWQTDDFVLFGETGAGVQRKLLGQVKRAFSISSSDEECQKTVMDCWTDFNNAQFDARLDRIAIVTMRGTTVLLEHFVGLLDCARASRNGAEFERRLTTPGFVSKKAVKYCDEVCKIISDAANSAITRADIWPLLRILHLLSFDLTTGTAQTEAAMKTLLAHTATRPDAVGAAEATWNALVREASDGTPLSRSYRLGDLPDSVRAGHSAISAAEDRTIRALKDHSSLILGGIRSSIADSVHLSRIGLMHDVLAATERARVILISGPAGSGKSGVAKSVLEAVSADTFTFCFRAEEFTLAHLDETLQKSLVPSNAVGVAAILAGQTRKLLLVESVERLLEASTRNAFADLLVLLRNDPSWKLLLTCRDYSTELVRSALLDAAGLTQSVVEVPQLSELELQEVKSGCAKLIAPLSSEALKGLLTSPYLLDRAASMDWPEDRPMPQNERDFRNKFWKEVIRVDDRASDGMPRRRDDTFMGIALGRARALSLYIPRAHLDPMAVDALRRDSLVIVSEESDGLVAPAHDVLEDWAILRWIGEQYAAHEQSLSALSAALGTYPAIRRTYRKWLSELLEQQSDIADSIFHAVATDLTLSAQFGDDTMVSLLRSPTGPDLLKRHRTLLFQNSKHLLKRVLHLLRVGCVKTPSWAGGSNESATSFHVPDSSSWAESMQLVCHHLDSFTEDDSLLLLGFIEDWIIGVTWDAPYPPGAEAVAKIAHHLLAQFDVYSEKEDCKRALQVIAKLPNADTERFLRLFVGDSGDESDRKHLTEELQTLVLEGNDGAAACRDQPEAVMRVARKNLFLTDDDVQQNHWWLSDPSSLEPLFGLSQAVHFESFPASAYHGFFLPLLRSHPRMAIDFVVELFNHSADWFAHPRTEREFVEPPYEILLTFEDGSQKRQWANQRLWNLYRGTVVGPYVLQSALMALERALFELVDVVPDVLDDLLQKTLKSTSSAAITGVVASLATAFPHISRKTLLVLLRSRECVQLDKGRLVHESQAPSRLRLPMLQASSKFYLSERKEADAKQHRSHDLETAVLNIQLGPMQARVHEVIDAHRAALPSPDQQGEEDRIWRLALHRMDLRLYEVAEDQSEVNRADGRTEDDGESTKVRVALKVPDADIQAMADKSASEYALFNIRIGLLNWAVGQFDHALPNQDPSQWREKLNQARSLPRIESDGQQRVLGEGAAAYVAAACVRDHFDQLDPGDREWCANAVCSAIEQGADFWDRAERMQRYSMSADRGCASAISYLVKAPLNEFLSERVLRCLVLALTHPVDEVRHYAASGVARRLWVTDPDLALRCANGFAVEALLVQAAHAEESKLPFTSRRSVDVFEAQAAYAIRENFLTRPNEFENALEAFDPTDWIGSEANTRILTILLGAPENSVSIQAFERLSETLVQWWRESETRRGHDQTHSHQVQSQLTDILENVILQVSSHYAASILRPALEAVNRHTRELSFILQGIVSLEDRNPQTERFWHVWELFAAAVKSAKWLSGIDREHAMGNDLLNAIFLTQYWKQDVRHWSSLDGHSFRIDALFDALPPSAAVFDNYVRFLYHIGEKSMPMAFVRLADRLKTANASTLLRLENTRRMLEILLRRHVYGRPLELKRNRNLRAAIIELLDRLVENGSSAAYRMRDDFVTPISAD